MLLHIARAYDVALNRQPLLVKAITTGFINFSADVCIQKISAPDQPWNAKRSLLQGCIYGACWSGPFMHVVTTAWGRILPSTTLPSLAFKSAVDVCTSLPVNICGILSVQAYCRGVEPLGALQQNLWSSWTASLAFWPAANMIVYRLPVIYRVLGLNTCSFIYLCGMISFLGSNPQKDTQNVEGAHVKDANQDLASVLNKYVYAASDMLRVCLQVPNTE